MQEASAVQITNEQNLFFSGVICIVNSAIIEYCMHLLLQFWRIDNDTRLFIMILGKAAYRYMFQISECGCVLIISIVTQLH